MPSISSRAQRLLPWAELAGFVAAGIALFLIELERSSEYFTTPADIFSYSPNPETTWVGLVLLVAPLVWWLGRKGVTAPEQGVPVGAGIADAGARNAVSATVRRRAVEQLACFVITVLLFCLAVVLTWRVGQVFRGMPPAYHDEYSYLFQAQTFLAGRLYFPSHPLAEFFDQMHVLNDGGVFASRYFPGVGLWLAPWVAIHQPYWGQYLAGGAIVVCVFWIGRELAAALDRTNGGPSEVPNLFAIGTGLLAALYCAISPAMLLFGNLLLSHHPTTLGLAVFLLSYLRALRSACCAWPLMGGVALSFAMLCRPLTAFGFAIPFACHLGWLMFRGKLVRARARLSAALAPIMVGVALLAVYNGALTGNPLRSPYGLYTRLYTPNHVYGFHNVRRGQVHAGPKVIENYNRWAEDLTWSRATRLLAGRMQTSAAWTIGRVSLAWVGGLLLILLPRLPACWKLLIAALVGVHAVYFPYSFEGVFGLSYVFETVPILCLLAAATCAWTMREWFWRRHWGRMIWLPALLVCAMLGPIHHMVQKGPNGWIDQIRFARGYYAAWETRMAQAGVRPPALIFVRSNPTDVHLNLVTNSPELTCPIIRARDLGMHKNIQLADYFSDRAVWFIDAPTRRLYGGWSFDQLREMSSRSEERATPAAPDGSGSL